MKNVFILISVFFAFGLNAQNPSEYYLPVFNISTLDDTINDEYKVSSKVKVVDFNGSVVFDNYLGIEYRGYTSQNFDKMSFDIELRDQDGEDVSIPLLGMPRESDWVLYAPYTDKSLIRNALIYELSRQSGFYAPRTRFCELVLDQEYQGVYLLIEKIKRDKNRVNVEKINSDCVSGDSLTGGYIFKADRWADSSYWYSSSAQTGYQIVYPKKKNIISEQKDYLKQYFNSIEKNIFSDTVNHNADLSGWINIESFVDYFLFSELSKNIDAYRLSTYFYKNRSSVDSLVYAGPLWDYNIAFGNANYMGGNEVDSILANRYPLWKSITSNSSFKSIAENRWALLRQTILEKDHISFVVDSLVLELGKSVGNNFYRWDIIGTYVWPNNFVGNTYDEEIDYLKGFLFERIDWLDSYFITTKYEDSINEINVKCYPNPFTTSLSIDFDMEYASVLSIRLYDIMGNEIIKLINDNVYPEGENRIVIDQYRVEFLDAGIYIVKVFVNNHHYENTILIKN